MKRICEGCGAEFDEHWMMSFNSGRKTHWFCWECWKNSQHEAGLNEHRRRVAIKKEMKSRGMDV